MPRIEKPAEPLDKAARKAIRRVIDAQGREAFAGRHELNPRTVERLYAGKMAVPPRLAGEIASALFAEATASDGATLREWADSNA